MTFVAHRALLSGRPVGNQCQCHPLTRVSLVNKSSRRQLLCASADVPFVLHLGDTTLTVPLSTEEGKNLSVKFNDLLKVFAAKQEAERPKRWEALEYKFEDSGTDAPISCLEIFCNPNMHSTAFDAKMLVTVKTPQGVNMMAEGSLSTIRADLQAFLGNTS